MNLNSIDPNNEIRLTINRSFNKKYTQFIYKNNAIYKIIRKNNPTSKRHGKILNVEILKIHDNRFDNIKSKIIDLNPSEQCNYCKYVNDGESWIIEFVHNNQTKKIYRMSPETARIFSKKNKQIDKPIESNLFVNLMAELKTEFTK